MSYLLVILMLIFSQVLEAQDALPSYTTCKPIRVIKEPVVLSSDKPALILIHNISTSDLWITHPGSGVGASAGWSSQIQAGNWSALVLQNKSFALSCIESKPGHEQEVPCLGLITLCQWSKATKLGEQNTGTYWAGENRPLAALMQSVIL